MKFTTSEKVRRSFGTADYPIVQLTANTWDDFGYKTSFDVSLFMPSAEREYIGVVKVLRDNQKRGNVKMPEGLFDSLDEHYCSLGQEIKYYERLSKLGPAIYKPFLVGLKDVVFDKAVRDHFSNREGFQVSLCRFGEANVALAQGSALLQPSPSPIRDNRGFRFVFETRLGAEADPVEIMFDFSEENELPNRINAVVGYNGTGKTQLLASLAITASGYGYQDKAAIINQQAGRFLGDSPPTGHVVVVSYSAFDRFEIPGKTDQERLILQNKGTLFGFAYCGLRERIEGGRANAAKYRLKSQEEILLEFNAAIQAIQVRGRQEVFMDILRPLMRDASFQRIGLGDMVLEDGLYQLSANFNNLSSGHKVVLKTIAELTAAIDGVKPSLIVIDEPESHLHPPLVASLLRSIQTCLKTLNGYAVVATHSPVVIQELPGRYVRKLYRAGNKSTILPPDLETFGENVGLITQEVFNLDDSSTDWHETLRSLVKTHSMSEIESMFDGKLSFTARSYALDILEDQNEA